MFRNSLSSLPKVNELIKRLARTIEKFNKELSEYIRTGGDDELPDIDSTCIGFSPVDFYAINGDEVTDCDGKPP